MEIATNILIVSVVWAGLTFALYRYCQPHERRIQEIEQLRAELWRLEPKAADRPPIEALWRPE